MNINKSVKKLMEKSNSFSEEENLAINKYLDEIGMRIDREFRLRNAQSIQDAERTYVYV